MLWNNCCSKGLRGKEEIMFRTLLTTSTIACALAFGVPTGSYARTNDAQNPFTAVGKATKEAGKATAEGAEKVGEKTADVTKDTAKKTAKGTKDVGKTVEGAVTPNKVSATCMDGRVHTGTTKAQACAGHGGLKH